MSLCFSRFLLWFISARFYLTSFFVNRGEAVDSSGTAGSQWWDVSTVEVRHALFVTTSCKPYSWTIRLVGDGLRVHRTVNAGEIEFGNLLAQGAAGKVYVGRWNDREVAVKVSFSLHGLKALIIKEFRSCHLWPCTSTKANSGVR